MDDYDEPLSPTSLYTYSEGAVSDNVAVAWWRLGLSAAMPQELTIRELGVQLRFFYQSKVPPAEDNSMCSLFYMYFSSVSLLLIHRNRMPCFWAALYIF
jgi:hypothetical protein